MAEDTDAVGTLAASPARTPAPSAAVELAERPDVMDYVKGLLDAGQTQGLVVVYARHDYIVEPTDRTLPSVTHLGVPMTREQYEALREEAGEYLQPKVEELEGR